MMMKKIIVLSLALALLSATVFPAYAGYGPQACKGRVAATSRGTFAMSGTLSSIDPATLTVTVTVVCGSKLVKPYIGQDLTIQTTDSTRFLMRNPDGTATPITFADLEVGQNVSINGRLANDVWIAGRITVGALLSCLP
jgi:hypothetical protein